MKKTSILVLLLTLCSITSAWAHIDCPTTATTQGGKMYFTSEKFVYDGDCNQLRFTLTESGAYYKNGSKRMSFDSFVLYNSKGEAITLTAKNVTTNNNKDIANMLDGENKTYCNGSWTATNATDDWFEVTLPYGI